MNALRTKSNSGRNLSRYERNELRRLEQDERLQHRIDRKKSRMKNNCLGKVQRVLKPFEVVFGFAFLAISLLMMVSLTITKYVDHFSVVLTGICIFEEYINARILITTYVFHSAHFTLMSEIFASRKFRE